MLSTSSSSSNNVIPFGHDRREPEPKGFEQAREAWLTWRADTRISHADRALIQEVYLGFNRQHYERTGELIAWPGWKRIAARSKLSKMSIFRGFRRFERFGILEIRRGGRDPQTGWKIPNSYLAIMPPGNTAIPGHQVSGRYKSRYQGDTRLSEDDSLKIKKEENSKFGNPRGPKAPEKESKPSSTDFSKPSPRSAACDVPGGGRETEAERRARWRAEGKSEFTGCPLWKRPNAQPRMR